MNQGSEPQMEFAMNQGSKPQTEFASEKYAAQVSDLPTFESTVGIRSNA
jgi:primosomal protein N''